MADVKHTRGPWRYLRDETAAGDEVFGFDVSAANGRSIVYFDADDAIETEANARLIAAAPTLLEALEELMRFHKGEGEYNFSSLPSLERANSTDDAWFMVRDKIEAAIALAKGEKVDG